jgi:intracellular multiplication protein IcmB
LKEIERRKSEQLRRGEIDARAQTGVVDELASELADAHGIGARLLHDDDRVPLPVASQ